MCQQPVERGTQSLERLGRRRRRQEAQFEQNQAAVIGALGRLLAVAEAYPDWCGSQYRSHLSSQRRDMK
jgi:hypothetical protein